MRAVTLTLVGALGLGIGMGAAAARDAIPAKVLFGHVATPSADNSRSIGFYAKGCLAGAVALPVDGPNWQVMRLSRNRNWGEPQLVDYVRRLSADAAAADGWPGLLVGDMSQPRGGPMRTGHASHQIGLDVDIWAMPMPDYRLSPQEREEKSAVSLLVPGRLLVDERRWSDAYGRLLKRAASYPEVERIFVNPAIKQKLCNTVGNDRAWLRKLRPWWGHDTHFHVRLACPPGMAGCEHQAPVGVGDGCGAELASWFKPPPKPKPGPKVPVKPKPEITLADLPAACTAVLHEGVADVAAENLAAYAATVPLPRLRPKAP